MKQEATHKVLLFLSRENPKADEFLYTCPANAEPVLGKNSNDAPVRYFLRNYKEHIGEIIVILTDGARENGFDTFVQLVVDEGFSAGIIKEIPYPSEISFELGVLPRILKQLEGGSKILIDITGGFRPDLTHLLLVTQVLSYKNIPYRVVFSNFIGEKTVNYLDNTVDLFKMITGMQEFIHTGSVATLREYYSGHRHDSKIDQLLTAMEQLNDGISLCAVNPIEKQLEGFNLAIKEAKTASDELFVQMIDMVQSTYGNEMDLPHLIVWCADHNMIQQAMTIYNEKLPRFLLESIVIPKENMPSAVKQKFEDEFYVKFNREILTLFDSKEQVKSDDAQKLLQNFHDAMDKYAIALKNGSLTLDELSDLNSGISSALLDYQAVLSYLYKDGEKRYQPKPISQLEGVNESKVMKFLETLDNVPKAIENLHLKLKQQLLLCRILLEKEDLPVLSSVKLTTGQLQINTIEHLDALIHHGYEYHGNIADLQRICRDYLYIKALRNRTNHANDVGTVDENLEVYFQEHHYRSLNDVSTVEVIKELILEFIAHVIETEKKMKKRKEESGEKKKVLWISRHTMTEGQIEDLERILQHKVELIPFRDSLESVEDLEESHLSVDMIAAVLPPFLLSQLVQKAGEIPVVQAVSKRVKSGHIITLSNGNQEDEYIFVHECWEQVVKFDLELKRL